MPKKNLRSGFTTGTAAAAATKAALLTLLSGDIPSRVVITLLTGDSINIAVHACDRLSQTEARCLVIKDAGDDPDITHKAKIGARVTLLKPSENPDDESAAIRITGGQGVGTVTKPGLEVPPGEPAINPGPRQMIRQAVRDVFEKYPADHALDVEIFVPAGEKLAKKTLNARLGILGGISILGTTGIVKPMSHDAFIATIDSGLSVARASGHDIAILTTGRRSERFSQILWPDFAEEVFIQIGDFFKQSLELAARKKFRRLTLAVFFGKALKMAQGVPHTHAAKSALTLDTLSKWALELTGNRIFSQEIMAANTARHAFDIIQPQYPEVIAHVGRQIVNSARMFAGADLNIRSVIFDYKGQVVFDSEKR